MDYAQLKKDLEGLYITIPTLFHDEDLSINEEGTVSYTHLTLPTTMLV